MNLGQPLTEKHDRPHTRLIAPPTAPQQRALPRVRAVPVTSRVPLRIQGEREFAVDVLRLLRDGATRVVTITGAGGAGKTRLAIRAARESIVLAMVERSALDDESSARSFELALGFCLEAGDHATAPLCLAGMAASISAHEPERAGRLLGAARALFDSGNTPQVPGFELYYEGTHEALAAGLGDALEPLIAEGRDDAARGAALMPGYAGV